MYNEEQNELDTVSARYVSSRQQSFGTVLKMLTRSSSSPQSLPCDLVRSGQISSMLGSTPTDEVLLTGMTLEGDVAGYPEHHRRPETHVFRASKAATKTTAKTRERRRKKGRRRKREEEEQEQEQDQSKVGEKYICVTSISQTR
jgi:hypothetical protein